MRVDVHEAGVRAMPSDVGDTNERKSHTICDVVDEAKTCYHTHSKSETLKEKPDEVGHLK